MHQTQAGVGTGHPTVLQGKTVGIIGKHRYILQYIYRIAVVSDLFGRLRTGDFRLGQLHAAAGTQQAAGFGQFRQNRLFHRGLFFGGIMVGRLFPAHPLMDAEDDGADLGAQQLALSHKAHLSVDLHALHNAGLAQSQHLRVGAVGKGIVRHHRPQAQRPGGDLCHLLPGDGSVQIIVRPHRQNAPLKGQIEIAPRPMHIGGRLTVLSCGKQDELEGFAPGHRAVGTEGAVLIAGNDPLRAQLGHIGLIPLPFGHVGIGGVGRQGAQQGTKQQTAENFLHKRVPFAVGLSNAVSIPYSALPNKAESPSGAKIKISSEFASKPFIVLQQKFNIICIKFYISAIYRIKKE